MALYNIVEFLDTSVGIVISKWLNEDASMTMWPPYSDRGKHKAALLLHEGPGEDWKSHEITILGTAGMFSPWNCCEFT